ncbi:MAG: DUF177 domain-containing protein [Bacteroidetes bacterium]|nr:DUF177 domain-containing protein [Bacteroidota bacterium]
MIIKYKNYTSGVHSIDERKDSQELGMGEDYTGDVLLSCSMDKSQHQILLNCEITANVKLSCDRCGEDFLGEIYNEFQVTCFFEEERESKEENVRFLTAENEIIDLSEEVKEYLTLAIPMKILCDDDCKGLCVSCGANLNEVTCECNKEKINPIWDELKKLKNNLNN